MIRTTTDEVLDELEFTEEERILFKKIRIDIKHCRANGLEDKINNRIKKMIEEVMGN